MLGLPLRARGVLLEHRAAGNAIGEAREAARARVRIPAVRDWIIDYTEPGAIWLVADAAWYRCAVIHHSIVACMFCVQHVISPGLRHACMATVPSAEQLAMLRAAVLYQR